MYSQYKNKYRIFKLVEITIRKRLRKKKKKRGTKSGYNTYIHGSAIILNNQKCLFFSFKKSENRKVKQVLLRGCWYQWDGAGSREKV
jgi:hypothetical protein